VSYQCEFANSDPDTTQNKGANSRLTGSTNRVLRRLGLLLSVDDGNVGNVNVDKVALASSLTELGQRLNEGHALNITDGTSLWMVSLR